MLLAINDESLHQAAQLIRRGDLVAFPTETVYGLGADAFNTGALARIFEVKGRPNFDPLIIHIAAWETLETIADVSMLDSAAQKNLDALTGQFWPGPLTLIVPKSQAVPDLATSGLPTVAVRMPAHEDARRLITLSTGAIAAPSANPFGCLSPTRAEHVAAGLGEKVAMILDGGSTQVGLESTVLDLCHGQPRILRPGGIPREVIEELIGTVATDTATHTISSPGMLKNHYAPRVPLTAHEAIQCVPPDKTSAFLFFNGSSRDEWLAAHQTSGPGYNALAVLSETGSLIEAASCLFETLHELDRPGIKQIHAQYAPETGLGTAINDRLRRAGYACKIP